MCGGNATACLIERKFWGAPHYCDLFRPCRVSVGSVAEKTFNCLFFFACSADCSAPSVSMPASRVLCHLRGKLRGVRNRAHGRAHERCRPNEDIACFIRRRCHTSRYVDCRLQCRPNIPLRFRPRASNPPRYRELARHLTSLANVAGDNSHNGPSRCRQPSQKCGG